MGELSHNHSISKQPSISTLDNVCDKGHRATGIILVGNKRDVQCGGC